MVSWNWLILDGPTTLMTTIEDSHIVEHQSILRLRWSSRVVTTRPLMSGILACCCLSFSLVLHHSKVEVRMNSSATFFPWRSNGQRVSQELLETWSQSFWRLIQNKEFQLIKLQITLGSNQSHKFVQSTVSLFQQTKTNWSMPTCKKRTTRQ